MSDSRKWVRCPLAWTAVGVFIVALFLRLLILWQVSHDPEFHEIGGDGEAYLSWANQIRQEGWVGREVFFQSPLYPYLAAGFQAIFGTELIRLLAFQAFIGAAGCTLLSIAASRLFDLRTGLLAGLMLAVYPPGMSYDLQVDKTVLDPPLIAAIVWAIAEILRRSTGWRWFACGAALGLISLTRENAAALFLPILIWLWWYFSTDTWKQRARWTGMLAAGIACLVLPICVRNMLIGGQFYLSTSKFGLNMYYGNAAHADGLYTPLRPGRGNAYYELLDSTEIAEEAAGRKLTPGEVSDYWTKRTLQDISQAPGKFVTLNLRKFAMFWSNAEIADADVHDRHVVYSPILGALDQAYGFIVVFPLAILGLALNWERRRELAIFVALAVVYGLAVSAFILFGRYRLPVVPLLLPLSAAAVMNLPRLRDGRRSMIAIPAILCAIGWVMVGDRMIPTRIRGSNEYNRALTYERAGDERHAEALYRAALQINPALNDARTNLGLMLVNQGKAKAAVEVLRPGMDHLPDAALLNNLGMALSLAGNLGEGILCFEQAHRLDPANATYRLNFAHALAMQGQRGRAMEILAGMPPEADAPTAERARKLLDQLRESKD